LADLAPAFDQFAAAQLAESHVGVAGDAGHRYAPQAVVVDGVFGHEVQEMLKRDPAFHASKGGAEAAVDVVSEAQVLCLGAAAIDVEHFGVGERPRRDFWAALYRRLVSAHG
jgi:hypothetical protein